jgi:hypothetical protein
MDTGSDDYDRRHYVSNLWHQLIYKNTITAVTQPRVILTIQCHHIRCIDDLHPGADNHHAPGSSWCPDMTSLKCRFEFNRGVSNCGASGNNIAP